MSIAEFKIDTTDRDRLDPIDREEGDRDIRKASGLIGGGFAWSDTKEGHDFWKYVSDRLCEIAGNRETAREESEASSDDVKEVEITIDGTEYIARAV